MFDHSVFRNHKKYIFNAINMNHQYEVSLTELKNNFYKYKMLFIIQKY